jgi:uncharacterized protein with HEPN domain
MEVNVILQQIVSANVVELSHIMQSMEQVNEKELANDMTCAIFIASSAEIMAQALKMKRVYTQTRELEKEFRESRKQIIRDLITYWLSQNERDDFFADPYRSFISKLVILQFFFCPIN